MSAKKKKKTKSLPPLLALILALLVFGYYFVSDYMAEKKARESWNTEGSLVMQVIDVGQGDSILLGCDGEYMLVDCGEEEYADTVLEAVRGLDLKYMLASHPHTDHMGGMSEVIRKHPPETFLMPEREHTTREFKAMLQAIEDKQVNAEFVYAGDEFELGSAYVTVVWPEIGFSDSNLNNWSAVLLVEYQGVSILLTGDSEKKVEDDYLKYIPGEIDILKVAHHGSDTSSGAKLLEAIDPDYAVLSLGAGNDYNHPHKEPMERLQNCGAEIYRTDRSGTITFTVKEGEISVATER